MKKSELERFIKLCGGKTQACAELGGLHTTTMDRWLAGTRHPSLVVERLIKLIEQQNKGQPK